MSVGNWVARVSLVPDCAFQFDFLPSKLYFSVFRVSAFEFMLHRDKNPQLTWRFSANRSKASFSSVHGSVVEPRLNAVFFSFFFFPSGDRNNAKYALQFSFHDPTMPRAFRVKAESKPVRGGQRLGPRGLATKFKSFKDVSFNKTFSVRLWVSI